MARTIGLHLRYPAAWTESDTFVAKLRSLFDGYKSGITFTVSSSEGAIDDRLDTVNVGACTDAATEALFKGLAPSGMSDDEILVLFAGELSGTVRWGCAQCPQGARGVIVSCQATPVALPHEIAHLFLGPDHDASTKNLMYEDTDALTKDPPLLLPSQITTLKEAEWKLPSAPYALTFTAVKVKPTPGKKKTTTKAKKKAPKKKKKKKRDGKGKEKKASRKPVRAGRRKKSR